MHSCWVCKTEQRKKFGTSENHKCVSSFVIVYGGTEERKRTSFRITEIIVIDTEVSGTNTTSQENCKNHLNDIRKSQPFQKSPFTLTSGRTLVEIKHEPGLMG